jgi:hypothetical protein
MRQLGVELVLAKVEASFLRRIEALMYKYDSIPFSRPGTLTSASSEEPCIAFTMT